MNLQVHCSRESINRMDEIASTSLAQHELDILHANSSSLDERSSGGGGPLAQIVQLHSPPLIVEFHEISRRSSRTRHQNMHYEVEDEQDSNERRETVHDLSSDNEEGSVTNMAAQPCTIERSDSVESIDLASSENPERQRLMENCTDESVPKRRESDS